MISVRLDSDSFMKDMMSVINYSNGFLDGARDGKKELLRTIGEKTVEILEQFIDSNARVNEEALHHVYEWYQAGSPNARLFNLEYFAYQGGLAISSSFTQSSTVKSGSSVPFYDKARIMEQGIPVRIRPVRAQVLRFEDNGEEVFTPNEVSVERPGGQEAQGGFKRVIDLFFETYFTQSFMQSSGIYELLKTPFNFKKNLPRAKTGGKSAGYDVGYRWISAKGVA